MARSQSKSGYAPQSPLPPATEGAPQFGRLLPALPIVGLAFASAGYDQ